MTQTVKEATKALWDYIESLEPKRREKALKYQRGLETEADSTPGGMMAVIPKRLQHARFQLIDALTEVQEVAAEAISRSELKRISRP